MLKPFSRKSPAGWLLGLASALITASAMAGCETQDSAAARSMEETFSSYVEGKEWLVQDMNGDMNGQGIVDRSQASLTFSKDGKLTGQAFCNRYFATYTLQPKLSIRNIGQTKKACIPALMQQERQFTTILSKVNHAKVTADGALILSTTDGDSITARQP